MLIVYGDSAPSYSTVKFWAQLFKQDRESLEDDPRSGRPSSAVTDENIAAVEKLLLTDRRFKVWQLAGALSISKDRIGVFYMNI